MLFKNGRVCDVIWTYHLCKMRQKENRKYLVQDDTWSKALQGKVGVVLLTKGTGLHFATLNATLNKITGISEKC